MNIIFLGSPVVLITGKNSIVVTDEFDFSQALKLDPAAVGVFMCSSKMWGHALVRNIRVDGIKNPLYCLMYGDQSDHTMIASILDAGADQVERFPVDPELFNAQLAAIVRRGTGNPDPIIRFGGMEFNQNTRTLVAGPKAVHLTESEANVFYAIVAAQGNTVTKQGILETIYGYDDDDTPEMKIIDVYICKLRRKMMKISNGLDFIMTIWGYGYAFRPEGFTPNIRKTLQGTQRFELERGPIRARQADLAEAAE